MHFLDILMEEHRGFSVMLDVLDAAAARLRAGYHVPPAMLADLLDLFENFTDRHHDREESTLFLLLARHGIGSDQTVVNALLSQHEAGRAYGKRMRRELKRLEAGAAGAGAGLATDADGYSELIREHIRIEDEYFYALADRVLTAAEHAGLEQDLELRDDGGHAQAERQRYLRMLEMYPAVVAGWRSEG